MSSPKPVPVPERIPKGPGVPRSVVFHRVCGIGAAGIWVVVLLGCMSISIGGRHSTVGVCEGGVYVQKGDARIGAGVEQDVYYPIPYAQPPHLEIEDCFGDVVVVDQKADHYRVRNTCTSFTKTAHWTAKGLRGGPPPCPPPCAGPPPIAPLVPVPQPPTPPEPPKGE